MAKYRWGSAPVQATDGPDAIGAILDETRGCDRGMLHNHSTLYRNDPISGSMEEKASFATTLRPFLPLDRGSPPWGPNRIGRDESLALLASLDRELPQIRQSLSNQQAKTVAATLKRRLLDAPRPLQRRYVRGLISQIVVDRQKAIISGPRTAIAAAASNPQALTTVPSFEREWRTRQDSNL
ncbi:MAG: hypothetical protein JSR55_12435 [Proteobacteria bacterium]|nr:hypothetical protein [Pseudomonadota bacterium]